MLTAQTAANGVVFYQSPLLIAAGAAHGFSTRIGGISHSPFDSLNLGNPNGCAIQDLPSHIQENYARFAAATGVGSRPILRVYQIHGPAVARVVPGKHFDFDQKADAIVTADSTRCVSVRIADCIPILISTPGASAVAAVHAGWRGIVSNVVASAVAALLEMAPKGTSSASLLAAIGPCIGPTRVEVGPEVLDEFAAVFGPSAPIVRRPDGKGLVDLPTAAHRQLLACGLHPDRIDTTDRCTHTHRDEFFSHRRDNGVTGRMAALIAPAAGAAGH
jgi:YfiH family protein